MQDFWSNTWAITIATGLIVLAIGGIWRFFFKKESPATSQAANQNVTVNNHINQPAPQEKVSSEKDNTSDLVFTKNSYWFIKNGIPDGPLCSRCVEADNKRIHMHPCGNPAFYECPVCKTQVEIYPEKDVITRQFNRASPINDTR